MFVSGAIETAVALVAEWTPEQWGCLPWVCLCDASAPVAPVHVTCTVWEGFLMTV
jgi:hypothetical protein